jgi:magnesium transporter
MTDTSEHAADDVQQHLREVQELLARNRLVEGLVHRQEEMPRHELVEQLVHKQNVAALQERLDSLHPADIAFILEALPREDRRFVWDLVKAERDGEILIEVSDAVRESLIEAMDPAELRAAAQSLDADELADLAPDLPAEVIEDVFQALDVTERERLRSAMSYPEDSVGALMSFDIASVREDVRLEAVLRYLRRFEALLLNDPERSVGEVMLREGVISFEPEDDAGEAAQAFERYDLISAPVIDSQRRVIGRLTVDDVVDFIREESEAVLLARAGLRESEDVFASVWDSVRNRWSWLAINLVTAFIASRVIDLFEDSIEKLVALAALMPIVAGIGGNSGNQTITMIVRASATGQVAPDAFNRLLRKELGVATINGLAWGGLLGVLAWGIYGDPRLGAVLTFAMTLNLLLAATAGVAIPMLRIRLGADPALGSSVLITALTDSGGFFIFLGLATRFLL